MTLGANQFAEYSNGISVLYTPYFWALDMPGESGCSEMLPHGFKAEGSIFRNRKLNGSYRVTGFQPSFGEQAKSLPLGIERLLVFTNRFFLNVVYDIWLDPSQLFWFLVINPRLCHLTASNMKDSTIWWLVFPQGYLSYSLSPTGLLGTSALHEIVLQASQIANQSPLIFGFSFVIRYQSQFCVFIQLFSGPWT